jgi:probable HAF family extracellular repeat protein
MRRFTFLVAVLALATAACEDPARPEQASEVRLAAPAPFVDVAATLQLSAEARDAAGQPLESGRYRWSSSDESVARVAGGLVTGVAPGTVTITAERGGARGEMRVTVEPAARTLHVPLDSLVLGAGVRRSLGASASAEVPGSVVPHSVVLASADTTVVKIEADTVLRAVAPGATRVTVRAGALSHEVHVVVVRPYSLTYLGTLPGDAASEARAVNDAGQVVGSSRPAVGPTRAFLWQAGTMTELPALPGGGSSGALDINESGVVAGFSSSKAVLWQGGAATELTPRYASLFTTGYDNFAAVGLNNLGHVLVHGRFSTCTRACVRSVLLRGTEALPIAASATSTDSWQAAAVNDAGQVVGTVETRGLDMWAFTWQNGAATEFSGSPRLATARDVNAAGHFVGDYDVTGRRRAYVSKNGAVTRVGAPSSFEEHAEGINDQGQVVGRSFVTISGRVVQLDDLLPNADWSIVTAREINNKGQIAATGQHRQTGATGALLLSPPAP